MSRQPELKTISQFSKRHPAFPEGGLRWMRFCSADNGYADAFVKVGRRVLIDEDRFFEIIREQNPTDRT